MYEGIRDAGVLGGGMWTGPSVSSESEGEREKMSQPD